MLGRTEQMASTCCRCLFPGPQNSNRFGILAHAIFCDNP